MGFERVTRSNWIFIAVAVLLSPPVTSPRWHQHPWWMALWAFFWLVGYVGSILHVRRKLKNERLRELAKTEP